MFFALLGLFSCNSDSNTKGSDFDELYAMAQDLENRNKPQVANVIYGNLLKNYPDHAKADELKSKMGTQSPAQIIENLKQTRLENPDQYGINRTEAFKFVDACEAYAASAPDDPKTPEYLFDAAEIAKLLKTYDKALSIYDKLITDYPDYQKTPSALFIKAFTLENELGRMEEAKEAYELFLERYPNNDFADDAQFSLENLGKSPEEVLKAIEEKNKLNQ